jgi:MarR family transcriptional regulator, organic hydroperoxide resistance regulator
MGERKTPLPGAGIPQSAYALVACIQRRLAPLFADTGLHWGLRRILQQLWLEDGLSQVDLARAIRSSEASASNMLKHLVAGGWVERRGDAFDYRVTRIYVTDKGRALRDAVAAECAKIDAEIRDALGPAEAAQLAEQLDRAWTLLAESTRSDEADWPGLGLSMQPSPPGQL